MMRASTARGGDRRSIIVMICNLWGFDDGDDRDDCDT
jgi:hypothetical protein